MFDVIGYEDRVPNIFAPIGPEYSGTYESNAHDLCEAVRYSTTIHVHQAGDYVIHYKAINRSSLRIDNQLVLDLYFFKLLNYMAPEKKGEETISLTAGDHSVEVITAYQRSTQPPEISIRLKGASAPGVSLWSSFDF
jgi:hypothetical protein